MRSVTALAASLALVLGAAACVSPTPYQPYLASGQAPGGFTDQRLDENHFRVTFRGNSMTSRERVETYLLYRAAELTASNGFDWFEMAQRHTENKGYAYVDPDPFYGPGYAWGYWRPYWRYHGPWGWGAWDPYWGGPFWGGYVLQRVDEYDAMAEIAVHHGPKPTDNPKAFDARQVMANLGPNIQRPQ